ncbi:hypothetical protein ACFIJ5_13690 [Haloimpatiens sp. FM7330]|uniref:hypothetical protein n=1 Tax=Haloimpatiens sp. FM7330 TaxID=3298610 RepID=UPI00362DEB39
MANVISISLWLIFSTYFFIKFVKSKKVCNIFLSIMGLPPILVKIACIKYIIGPVALAGSCIIFLLGLLTIYLVNRHNNYIC